MMTRNRSRLGNERGAGLPFVALILPALVAFAGLAFDGGTIFVAKREALNVATAAARAGAADVTEASLYSGLPQLAPTAPATAGSFASNQGYLATVDFAGMDNNQVSVQVQIEVDLLFFPAPVMVTGDAIAQVESFALDG